MKYLYLFLATILIIGCSGKECSPNQVTGEVIFGKYIVSPPMNYWYYPRDFPSTLNNSDDIFILTFHEHKKALTAKYPDKTGVIFTIAIAKNKYSSANDYYDESGKVVEYSELPGNDKISSIPNNWSCKTVVSGMHGIECIYLGEYLVTIGEFGYENYIISENFHLLHKMLLSFKEK